MKIYEGRRQLIRRNSIAVYADVEQTLPVIDIHKQRKKSGSMEVTASGMVMNLPGLGDGTTQIPLDFPRWLPFAAPKYQISGDINDYIVVPVIAIPSDLPNRNRIAFPLKELLAFNPELGMQTFETWKGKPTYREHKNDVLTEAYGVVADTSMRKLEGWSGNRVWKLLMLATFDRSKYVEYVAEIVANRINSYSMGAWVGGYECSVCDAEVGKCGHVSMEDHSGRFSEHDGKLGFKNCTNIQGFEISSVATPAWLTAISDSVSRFSEE